MKMGTTENGRRQLTAKLTTLQVVTSLIALVCFPPTGVLSIVALFRARSADSPRDRRIAIHRFQHWVWFSVGIAAGIYAVLLLVAILIGNDFTVAKAFFDLDVIRKSAGPILKGFGLTIALFMVAEVFILVWALFVAIIRSLPGPAAAPARWLAVAYVDIFRGLPALLVILMVALGLRASGLPIIGNFSDFESAVAALTLVYGAYVAEIFRGGIDSVHWSQSAASRSLGFNYFSTMRYVILPQAVRNMAAPLLNAFISLQKDTSLVAFIGLLDAVNRGRIESIQLANLSPLTGVAIGFIVLTVPTTRLTEWYVNRTQLRQSRGRA